MIAAPGPHAHQQVTDPTEAARFSDERESLIDNPLRTLSAGIGACPGPDSAPISKRDGGET